MREMIDAELKQAIKAQDKRRMSTLRLISAAIKDRDIAARSNGQDGVGEGEVLEILAKMIKQRQESIKTYEEAGRLELVEQEKEEMEIIRSFLPEQLSEEETKAAVAEALQELGCEGLKDMGRTMGLLKQRYAGQMDFAMASQVVKAHLKESPRTCS